MDERNGNYPQLVACECGHEIMSSVWPVWCICNNRVGVEPQCKHLGEQTGNVVFCRTCGKGTVEVPVYRCDIHGVCLLRKPTAAAGHQPWDGENCVTCSFRE